MVEKRIIAVEEEYDDTKINEWETYEQIAQCCQEIPGADPCTDMGKTETWNGYPQSEDTWDAEKIYNTYKARIGDRLIGYQVDSVGGPTNGGPCGEQHTTWEGWLGCCEDPAPLQWGSHPSTVERDTTYFYSASGGVEGSQFSGYSWSVVGTGLTINGNGLNAKLRVDTCFCKPGLVICTDACGQQIIQLVSLSDGTWSNGADTYYQSDYGWRQDGSGVVNCTGGAVIINGFNSDRTKHSQQAFGQVCYTKATPAETDETAIAGICAAGIAQEDYGASGAVSAPGDSEGYTKCGGGNVWYKDVSDQPSFGGVDFHAYYQTTSGSTREYTPGVCEEELIYDDVNSVKVLADDSYGIIYWEGGIPPYTVTVSGVEVWADADKTLVIFSGITGHSHRIYSGDTCGYIEVTVTDSCGVSVYGDLKAADGYWTPLGKAIFPDAESYVASKCVASTDNLDGRLKTIYVEHQGDLSLCWPAIGSRVGEDGYSASIQYYRQHGPCDVYGVRYDLDLSTYQWYSQWGNFDMNDKHSILVNEYYQAASGMWIAFWSSYAGRPTISQWVC